MAYTSDELFLQNIVIFVDIGYVHVEWEVGEHECIQVCGFYGNSRVSDARSTSHVYMCVHVNFLI